MTDSVFLFVLVVVLLGGFGGLVFVVAASVASALDRLLGANPARSTCLSCGSVRGERGCFVCRAP